MYMYIEYKAYSEMEGETETGKGPERETMHHQMSAIM